VGFSLPQRPKNNIYKNQKIKQDISADGPTQKDKEFFWEGDANLKQPTSVTREDKRKKKTETNFHVSEQITDR